MKWMRLLLCFMLVSCASWDKLPGRQTHFEGELVTFKANGKDEVSRQQVRIKRIHSDDGKQIYEWAQRRDVSSNSSPLVSEVLLTQIGQSLGYRIEEKNQGLTGQMSFENAQKLSWNGEIFFNDGSRITYHGVAKEQTQVIERKIFNPQGELVSLSREELRPAESHVILD